MVVRRVFGLLIHCININKFYLDVESLLDIAFDLDLNHFFF